MGMFDHIKVTKKFPVSKELQAAFGDVDWREIEYQTKDLDSVAQTFTIKPNGYLYTDIVGGEWVRTMTEEEEAAARKKGDFFWPHEFKETSRKTVIHRYTGDLHFYNSVFDKNENNLLLLLILLISPIITIIVILVHYL